MALGVNQTEAWTGLIMALAEGGTVAGKARAYAAVFAALGAPPEIREAIELEVDPPDKTPDEITDRGDKKQRFVVALRHVRDAMSGLKAAGNRLELAQRHVDVLDGQALFGGGDQGVKLAAHVAENARLIREFGAFEDQRTAAIELGSRMGLSVDETIEALAELSGLPKRCEGAARTH